MSWCKDILEHISKSKVPIRLSFISASLNLANLCSEPMQRRDGGGLQHLVTGMPTTMKRAVPALGRTSRILGQIDLVIGHAWACFDACVGLNLLLYVLWFPILEFLFLFRVRNYMRLRGATSVDHTEADVEECKRFWNVILSEGGESVERILRGWFPGSGNLHRSQIDELMAWTLFNTPASRCDSEQRKTMRHFSERMRTAMEMNAATILDGDEPCSRGMLHTLEPLAAAWKPLGFYLLVRNFCTLAHIVLTCVGFKLCTCSETDLEYYYYPGKPATDVDSDSQVPLVVMHGVGGFPPLVPLLLKLRKARPGTPLLLPLFSHCAMLPPPYDPPPLASNSTLVRAIQAIVTRHSPSNVEVPRANFIGHSLGTALLASMIKAHPTLVASALFIDPICFLLYQSVPRPSATSCDTPAPCLTVSGPVSGPCLIGRCCRTPSPLAVNAGCALQLLVPTASPGAVPIWSSPALSALALDSRPDDAVMLPSRVLVVPCAASPDSNRACRYMCDRSLRSTPTLAPLPTPARRRPLAPSARCAVPSARGLVWGRLNRACGRRPPILALVPPPGG